MRIKRMGWRADLPDFRDYPLDHPKLPKGFAQSVLKPLADVGLKAESDLTGGVARLVDQGEIGSCTGHGVIALHEYADKKAFGRFTPLSRLFIYKATRNWMGVRGDTGAEIRNAMGALALFGAPPEEHYPYDVSVYDQEPSPFIYQLASNFKGTQYARLDRRGMSGHQLLEELKGALLHGWPFVFGFTCWESLDYVTKGRIPFPKDNERIVGGHCVDAIGFSDSMDCPNASRGAFLILNSWGRAWGDDGYGWLPYDYFLRGAAQDCWILTKADWVDTEAFK